MLHPSLGTTGCNINEERHKKKVLTSIYCRSKQVFSSSHLQATLPALEMGISQNNKQTKTNCSFRRYLTLTKEIKKIHPPSLSPCLIKTRRKYTFPKETGTHFLQKWLYSICRLPFNTDIMLNIRRRTNSYRIVTFLY